MRCGEFTNPITAEIFSLVQNTSNLTAALAATFSQNATIFGLDFYQSEHLRLHKLDEFVRGT